MKPKETFLKRIEDQIKMLRDAYEFNKTLPDSFFENLQLTPTQIENNHIKEIQSLTPSNENNQSEAVIGKFGTGFKTVVEQNNSDYGKNKRLVLQILSNERKAMRKADIITKFYITVHPTKDQTDVVTNALAALSTDKEIIGWKPKELKIRGYYWALANWWDKSTNDLKNEYKPEVKKTSILDYV